MSAREESWPMDALQKITAQAGEQFSDYVLIGRTPDGLVWSFSDRTFALGATMRIQGALHVDDQMGVEEMRDRDNG